MRFLKTLDNDPNGPELIAGYEAAGRLRTLTETLEHIDLVRLSYLINTPNRWYTNEDELIKILKDVRTALECGICHGSGTKDGSVSESYKCSTCNGTGRRIPYTPRPEL